jgi:hypothetical protein
MHNFDPMNQFEINVKRIRKIAKDIADITDDIENNKSRTTFFAELIRQRVFEIYDLSKELASNDVKEKESQFLKPKSSRETFRTEQDAQNALQAEQPLPPPAVVENEKKIEPLFEMPKEEIKKEVVETPPPAPQTENIDYVKLVQPPQPKLEPIEEITSLLNEDVKNPEPTPVPQSKKNSPSWLNQLLEETIEKKRKSHDITQRMENSPLTDLTKAISISQKHEFITGLFAGDSSVFKQTIDKVQQSNGVDKALTLLEKEIADQYQWQKKEKLVSEFIFLVQRRFL